MTTTLRLVGSVHHGGLLYLRIEQAGLTIVSRDIARDEFEVEGDPAALQRVIDEWGGEGRVERC